MTKLTEQQFDVLVAFSKATKADVMAREIAADVGLKSARVGALCGQLVKLSYLQRTTNHHGEHYTITKLGAEHVRKEHGLPHVFSSNPFADLLRVPSVWNEAVHG